MKAQQIVVRDLDVGLRVGLGVTGLAHDTPRVG